MHSFFLVPYRYFYDDRWTKNRAITSLDWSSVFPELLAASYDKNPESASDPDGVCLVWNTRFKKTTPEHVFHCQSQVGRQETSESSTLCTILHTYI